MNLLPDEYVRLEIVRHLIAAGVPHEMVIKAATPLFEWILGYSQKSPLSIESKQIKTL